MDTLKTTKELLKKYNLNAKKGFGQNFLIDDNVLEKIVEAGEVSKNDIVIEIGPGLGNLTEYLLDSASQVIAYEIDKDMIEILENRFCQRDNLKIINKDIMDVDLNSMLNGKKVKVIANLPYYITTPILFKLLENKENISRIVIMVQKEVADRLLAKPHSKDYGVLTINTNYVCDTNRVINVPNTSFIPAPNVTSSVVSLNINKDKASNIKDEVIFKKLVKASFAARRKKLLNSILTTNSFNFSKEELTHILQELSFNENIRPEELAIDDYIKIANYIIDYTT